jgi:hypothetical protein
MPAPPSTALLVAAAILTCISPLAAVIVAGVVVLFEIILFIAAGAPDGPR